MSAAFSGEEVILSPGEQLLDMVYILDVVKAFEKLLQQLNRVEVAHNLKFQITSFKPISIKELAKLVENETDRKIHSIWGGRSYRKREVMKPWIGLSQPEGWAPEITLKEGIKIMAFSQKDL